MQLIATTTQSKNAPDDNFNQFLLDSGIAYVRRHKESLRQLRAEYQADGVIVWDEPGPVLYTEGQKFFFHPSMAKNRIAMMRHEQGEDSMGRACGIENGDSFLDCTLGLGADSIVAAYLSGNGQIVGLEKSFGIFAVVKWGMKHYHCNMPWLEKAIKRINVVNADHSLFLKQQPDQSFDIVYFDPMFRHPLMQSLPLAPLRPLAETAALSPGAVKEACRVARKRVVMKERVLSGEFERLGFTRIAGSKHNKIGYGVIDVL